MDILAILRPFRMSFTIISIMVLLSLFKVGLNEETPIEYVMAEEKKGTESEQVVHLSYIGQFGQQGEGDGEFGGPFGVHVSPEHEIFVADDLGHSIQIFSPKSTFLRRIGKHGKGPGEFAYLDCVITDKNGRMFVADTGNSRVQVLDPTGKFLSQVRHWGLLGRGFGNPRDFSFDHQQNLFVTDWTKEGIFFFFLERKAAS